MASVPRGFSAPDPAPGGLEIVQAFLNTAAIRKKREEIGTPRELARWLERRGLWGEGVELTAADHQRAIAAREALRSLLAANNGGKFNPKAVDRLEETLATTRFKLRFDIDGSPHYEPDSKGVDRALGKLLAHLVAAWNGGQWPLFKTCGDPTCRAAFFDASKRAKWCTRRCGDRVRALAYRQGDSYKLRRRPRRTITFMGEKFRL